MASRAEHEAAAGAGAGGKGAAVRGATPASMEEAVEVAVVVGGERGGGAAAVKARSITPGPTGVEQDGEEEEEEEEEVLAAAGASANEGTAPAPKGEEGLRSLTGVLREVGEAEAVLGKLRAACGAVKTPDVRMLVHVGGA